MRDEIKKEFARRITQADSLELVIILYEMTIEYINDAEKALSAYSYEEYDAELSRARNCILELIKSLHLEYQPAPALRRLYEYCIRLIAEAEAGRKIECLENIKKVLVPLKDAYSKISESSSHDVLMENSQKLYAGLTYGRGTLNESIFDQGGQRGFYV